MDDFHSCFFIHVRIELVSWGCADGELFLLTME